MLIRLHEYLYSLTAGPCDKLTVDHSNTTDAMLVYGESATVECHYQFGYTTSDGSSIYDVTCVSNETYTHMYHRNNHGCRGNIAL